MGKRSRANPNYIDHVVGAMVFIDSVHSEIHEGHFFECTAYDNSIDNAAAIDLLVVTGSRRCHIVFQGAVGGNSVAYLYENTTVSDNGAAVTIHNKYRNALMSPSVAVYSGPTITSVGVLLHSSFLPGGTKSFAGGGQTRTESEWVLKPNANYLARMVNISGGAVPASIALEWYEEE